MAQGLTKSIPLDNDPTLSSNSNVIAPTQQAVKIFVETRFGSTSFIINEVPSGTVNGSNLNFTIANAPVGGSLQVYHDGVLQKYSTDYTLSGTTITFVTAPLTGAILQVCYQLVVATAGNADTLDGHHAGNSSGEVPINNTLLNVNLNADLLDSLHAADLALVAHTHSKLIGSDGSPDPAISSDADGNGTVVGSLGFGTYGRLYSTDISGAGKLELVNQNGYVVWGNLEKTLNDDTATNWSANSANRQMFSIEGNGQEGCLGFAPFNGTIVLIYNSGAFAVTAGTGALTGTTGTDGKINLRMSNGALYIENRIGAARNLSFTMLSASS